MKSSLLKSIYLFIVMSTIISGCSPQKCFVAKYNKLPLSKETLIEIYDKYPRPIRDSVAIELAEDRKQPPISKKDAIMMEKGNFYGKIVRPTNFPKNKTWKPRRYFGQHQTGSNLEEIQIFLDYSDPHGGYFQYPNMQLCFNDFFSTLEKPDEVKIFKIYFRSNYVSIPVYDGIIPDNSTPAIDYDYSNAVPSKTILQLDYITNSSKYGGSIKLSFELADYFTENNSNPLLENFGIELMQELNSGTVTYDINDLRIDFYVKPKLALINPRAQSPYNETFVEIIANSVNAYQNNRFIEEFDNSPYSDSLDIYLTELEERFCNFAKAGVIHKHNLATFAHAWIHYQHQALLEDFNADEKATNLYIADDFLDIVSEKYEPIIMVFWQIGFYSPRTEPNIIGSETSNLYKVNVDIYHSFEDRNPNQHITSFSRFTTINDDQSWCNIGVFNADELETLQNIKVRINVKEIDVWRDDIYNTCWFYLKLDKDKIKQKIAESDYTGPVEKGVWILGGNTVITQDYYEELGSEDYDGILDASYELVEDGEAVDDFSFKVKVNLVER